MKVAVLGSLDLTIEGTHAPLNGTRPRRILTALAVEANQPVSTDRLIELVWDGAPPPSARNTLQSHVSRLRRQIHHDRLVRLPQGYSLQVTSAELDVLEFEELVAAAAQHRERRDHAAAAASLSDALALWRGLPFADLADDDRARARAAELERLRTAATDDLLEARLALGQHRTLLPELDRLGSERPLDERLSGIHALALYRAGDQPGALSVLRRFRATMRDQLGLDPSRDLGALEQQLLTRDPRLDLSPTSPQGPADGGAAPAEPTAPFVGRSSEVQMVHELVLRAGAGRGAVALVSGDPGIGKTRLAEQVQAGTPAGYDVLWGSCFDDRAAPPLSPWRQVLAGWLAKHPHKDLGAAWSLASRTLDIETRAESQLEDAHHGVAAVVSVLHAAARVRPLMVVLDDVHWADEATVRVLELLSRDVAASPIAVLSLFRDAEVDQSHPFRSVAADLGRRTHTVRVELGGLDRHAIGAYLEHRGRTRPADWLVERLLQRTGGNPFYLTETVEALLESGTLDDLAPDTDWPLPAGVRGLTWQRLDRLPALTGRLLRAGAVGGAQLDVPQLAGALALTTGEVISALDPAIAVRLLEIDPHDPARLHFVHALVRDAVVAQLTTSERLALHQQLGNSLISGAARLGEETTLRAARHFVAAAVLDNTTATTAVSLSLAAADHAAHRGVPADAVAHLTVALDIAQRHTDLEDARTAGIELRLAGTLRHAGDLLQAAIHFRQAADRASGHDLHVEAEAALGFETCSVDSRRHREAGADPSLTLLERALSGCSGSDVALRVSLLGALSQALVFCGQPHRATQVAEAAVTEARELTDDRLLARTLVTQYPLLDGHRDLEARVDLVRSAWEAADRGGEPEAGMEARRLGVPDLMRLGRIAEAQALVDTLESLAEAAGSEPYRWHVPMWRAAVATAVGRYEDAEILVERFLAAGRHHGYADTDRVHAIQLMLLRTGLGDSEAARSAVERAADDVFEPWAMTRVMTDAATGRLDRARTGFRRLSAQRFRLSRPYAGIQTFTACLLAEPCLLIGDPVDARVLFDLIAPAAGQNMVLGAGAAILGDARHHLGVLASQMGEPDLARKLLTEAEASNAAWGLGPAARRSAEVRDELGRSPDAGHRGASR